MKYRERKFITPIYGTRIVVIQTDSKERAEKKYGLDFEGAYLHAHSFWYKIIERKVDYQCVFIVFRAWGIEKGIVAHEAFHATSFILDEMGIHADHNNDEAQAYLLGYLVDELHAFLK